MKKILLLSVLVASLTTTAQAQTISPASSQKEEVVLYPNPAQSEGLVNIRSATGFIPQSALLSTSSGKPLVYSGNVTTQSALALPPLSSGIYFLTVFDKDKNKQTKKIIVY